MIVEDHRLDADDYNRQERPIDRGPDPEKSSISDLPRSIILVLRG